MWAITPRTPLNKAYCTAENNLFTLFRTTESKIGRKTEVPKVGHHKTKFVPRYVPSSKMADE